MARSDERSALATSHEDSPPGESTLEAEGLGEPSRSAAFPLKESWQAQGDHAGRWHHTIVVDRGEAPGITSSAKTSDEFLAGQR